MPLIEQYLKKHASKFESTLFEFLRIPTVSADPVRKADIAAAAQWLADLLSRLGLNSRLIPTAGNPLVYAESPPVPGMTTVLVYGHYDVQPVDPLSEWLSPPFEPTKRDGYVYARGASDDKGQLLTHILSTEAWLATEGRLPIQVKFLIEGEEEVGSAGLAQFLDSDVEQLACDCIVISDTAQFAPGQPAITYGLRGIAYYELKIHGPNRDLHSGSYGGAVTNSANVLAKMLAQIVDERGKIQVPGFYDRVLGLSDRERTQLSLLPFDEKEYWSQLGVDGGWGEAGYTPLERCWTRPAFDISGLTAGYQGPGAKTIIPRMASAKFSFRLVPDQEPEEITRSLETFLQELCPPGVRMELTQLASSPGMVVSLDSPYFDAARAAIEHGFGRPPIFVRSGGSIPIVSKLHQVLKVDVLLLGWGQEDDNAHSPNERFSLADFHRGIRTSARLWRELSRLRQA